MMSPRRDRSDAGLLVLVDVGNTNTVVGIFRGDDLIESYRFSTDAERTADEYGALLLPLLAHHGVEASAAEAVVISSVVPPLHLTLETLAQRYFGRKPLFVEPGIRTGMPIRYDNPTRSAPTASSTRWRRSRNTNAAASSSISAPRRHGTS